MINLVVDAMNVLDECIAIKLFQMNNYFTYFKSCIMIIIAVDYRNGIAG